MLKLHAVIFDLDDTLYPERSYVISGFREVAIWVEEHFNIPLEQGLSELLGLFNNGIRGDTFDRWLKLHSLNSKELVSKVVKIYREHNPQILPYPEVPELLQRLRLNYRLGVVSDGYVEVQKRKVISLGLTSFFDIMVFTDEFGRESWKPNPQALIFILQRLNIRGPEAVYIGDNPIKDFLGAKQVGMWTIRVRRPDGLYSHIEPQSPEYAADIEIESLISLKTILTQWEE
jgi:putative hydrolase of the HAD superfamily